MRGSKTVHLEDVSIWWDERRDRIKIRCGGDAEFISTVSADPKSKRGNPNLFYKLAKRLRAAGVAHPPIPETVKKE